MIHSVYQLAVFNEIENGTGSVIIDAKAGSGKTTTILEACGRLPSSSAILFLAFNVDIVKVLKNKLPSSVACSTFNSCGWRAWLKYTGKKFMKVEPKKTQKIIWDYFSDEDQVLYGAFVNKMVALAKSSGLTPNDSDEKWWSVQDHHGVMLSSEDGDYDRAMLLSKKTLDKSIEQANVICDFDDQIYMPWLRKATFEKYDTLFIDESQDTNSVQKELLARMLKPGGRLVAVGDPNQAIYGFRGADATSMDQLREKFNATVLPLSISYRCSKAVVREAQKYVAGIEAFEHAPEGSVEKMMDYAITDFTTDDAVLCRNNAPLIKIAYQIISRGLGVNFLGRDLGGGLKALVSNMVAKDLTELSVKLGAWLERESDKLIQKKQEEKIEQLEDKVNCIEIFMQYLPENRQTIPDLLAAIDSLFDRKGGITLSSAHKSKGREWHNVFILDFEKLMPSKWAKKDWQVQQENNLIYVAITRAQLNLRYIQSDSWKDQPNLVLPEKKVVSSTKKATGKLTKFNPFDKN